MLTAKEPFFLFGMGNRRKMIYQAGALRDVRTQEVLHKWDIAQQTIRHDQYRVELTLKNGDAIALFEDETGVHLDAGENETVDLTLSPLSLPQFEGAHAGIMRRLHHEILINIVDGAPLPNLFVYDKPWYREAAMIAYALSKTGNIDLVRDWVLSLTDVFDHNNMGYAEADNPGEVLVMLALCGVGADDPLAQLAIAGAERFEKNGYIEGMTDFAPHAFYQTGWMKWGLELMGLPDPYDWPNFDEEYEPLFWMNEAPRDSISCFDDVVAERFPAMKVAELHYYGEPIEKRLLNQGYPLTWESHATEANYAGMSIVDAGMVKKRMAAPHAGHAAEALLHLMEIGEIEV